MPRPHSPSGYTGDLLSVVDLHDHADEPWRDCAERAVREMAGRRVDFTAEDLSDLGVPDPDVPARWGSLFAAMKKQGVVRPVGWRTSRKPSRNAAVVRVWQGVAA